ncbi:MAG: ABC transporter ATP-binding protein [Rhodospirillales bacterium]|nr:ABC transporter ATP-binding protein [Rhodospirillales bacterium]
MLRLEAVHAYYGRAHILAGIDLAVERGEAVVLLGRNGAGKTTTLKAAMGLVPVATGRVVFLGADIAGRAAHEIARIGIGYVPEDRRIFAGLTVMENLAVGRQPPRRDAPTWTVERLFGLFPNLAAMRDRPGGRMSGGEQQMLSIARTLMGNPRLVLLDEPVEGLAPAIVEEMARTVLALKREGLTVLLSEQNLAFARLVADRAYVIEKGQLRFSGTMAALMADAAARTRYLSI